MDLTADLSPGFGDPVTGAQACFRAVLDAMARPGHVHRVFGVSAPAPLCNTAAAVLLTLTDHETPLWLDPAAVEARAWIGFHTGAPLVPAGRAAFAMALWLPDLADLPNGTDEMPETSATVILQVASLTAGRRFVLEGPGLRDPSNLRVDGLPDGFAAIWQHNHALFPRGVDLILCAGNSLTALPRSVTVREA
jgi:alpha-D-ribose 1-methylphosphonate 5-triphosphate synthase subunit PhnH